MARFRKKPVVVEAMRLPAADEDASPELIDWLDEKAAAAKPRDMRLGLEPGYGGALLIHTLEGTMEGQPGDWIICGVQGELYPCKPDIFEATYEPASEGE